MEMLKQVFFEMKHQKMMTWVSVTGIALSIFLVMVFFMVDKFPTVEVAPEINRSRMLYGGQYELLYSNFWSTGSMSLKNAKKIYSDLKGVEKLAYTSNDLESKYVGLPGLMSYPLDSYSTDADFWKMYDFNFIHGNAYDEASVESGAKVAVITRSVAQKLFERDDVVGEQISINKVPHLVKGVIKDVIPSMKATYSMVYTPLTVDEQTSTQEFGSIRVHILMKEGVDEDEIKDQVKTRFAHMEKEYGKDSIKLKYRGQPYNTEIFGKYEIRGNATPDLSYYHKKNFMTYSVLLLVPAINLCCILRGRLRHRISEIGVRRAFGAKKTDIIMQLLCENLIITILGGLIGFALSLITTYFASDYFFNITPGYPAALDFVSNRPEISMLITWKNFFISIAACFVLNLISAILPVWRASLTEPAEAIYKSRI